MSIRVNTYQLQSKSAYAASVATQLRDKASQINNIYYDLDTKVKNRRGIGSSLRSLHNRIDNAQRKMYNISKFLDNASERYDRAEAGVAARAASLGSVKSIASINVNNVGALGNGAAEYRAAIGINSKDVGAVQAMGTGTVKNGKLNSALDALQTVLDIAGFIPGLGDIADGINIAICLARGDIIGALLSAVGMIPVIGSAVAVPLKMLLRAAGDADKIADALRALAAIFGGMDKVVDGLKAILYSAADILKGLPNQLASILDNKLVQKSIGAEGVRGISEMIAGMKNKIDDVVEKSDDIVKDVKAAVGKNSEVTNLLDNMPELTGSNRDKLLSAVQNPDLRKIVDQLYRPGATVGDGGTASKLVQEFYEGCSTHLIKAQERLNQLNNLAKSGKLGLNDLDILDALRNDLNNAINLFK